MNYYRTGIGCICVLAGAIFLAINSLILFRGAYKFGHDEVDKIAFGIAAAVVPWVIAVLPLVIGETWRRTFFGLMRPSASTLAVLVLWGAFIAYNLTNGAGVIATSRLETVADRDKDADNSKSLKAERDIKLGQIAGIPQHRPAETVERLLAAERNNRRWMTTAECTEATSKASRDFCDGYRTLEGELASARAADKLTSEVAALNERIASLRPALSSSDPQADLLHDVTGAGKDKIQIYLPASTPIVLEMGASLMWHIGFSVLGISLRADNGRAAPRKAQEAEFNPAPLMSPERANAAPVVDLGVLTRQRQLAEWFWRECTKPNAAGNISEKQWYEHYCEICHRHRDTPLPLESFRRIASRSIGLIMQDLEDGKYYSGYLPFIQSETAA